MFQVFKLSFLTRIPRARSASPRSGCPSRGEAQRRRVRRVLFSRVEHVERVEMFMLAARPYSSIIYSGSSIEASEPFIIKLLQPSSFFVPKRRSHIARRLAGAYTL